MRRAVLLLVLAAVPASASVAAADDDGGYFRITAVDGETGRGVPLVEFRTTGGVLHVTDSNGHVAFREPGLMGEPLWFHVKSHGYEVKADGFGFRGVRLTPVAGKSAEVKLTRRNVAERLYRVTGAGIYHDSVLLGEPVPIERPLLNGGVLGQDSVQTVVYRGKLFWFWGDTNRAAYPLGNFAVSGATSELPAAGGLDPSVGVNLTYFVGDDGFSRPMCPLPGPGPKWIDGLMLLADADGRERLVAKYVRVKTLSEMHERGLVIYDDGKDVFEKLVEFDLDEPLYPLGHPVEVTIDGERYYCFGSPFPCVRVRADLDAVQDPDAYEAFTCLDPGVPFTGAETEVKRDAVYTWKRGAHAVGPAEQAELLKAGKLDPANAWIHLRDVESGKAVRAHGGSVHWNAYRGRWIAIVLEGWGASMVGEIWYAEADTLLGPWVYARKVVTHDKYSCYNPKHHPWFDADGGRTIHFEGTYTSTFSGNPEKTPRYDYNQIMYRLSLDDPRVVLPVPVYRLDDGSLATRGKVEADGAWERIESIPFFALDRPKDGAVALGDAGFGLPPDAEARPGALPIYRVDGKLTLERPGEAAPVARVWRNPAARLVLDRESKPVPIR